MAERLGWSQSKVSRIEAARTRSELEDVAALLEALEVPVALRADLLTLAEEAAGPAEAWRNSSRVGLTRRQQDFINSEASASRLRHYQPVLLPGYLQTPEYARRVIELAGSKDVERALSMRLARGAVVRRSDAPRYEVVLLETVLRWRPVAPDLMAAQLFALEEVARRRNVEVRVVSLDDEQSVFVQHPFVLYDFPAGAPSEVLVETTRTDLRLTDEADVTAYAGWFNRLWRAGLPRKQSMMLIRTVAQQMHDQHKSMEGR